MGMILGGSNVQTQTNNSFVIQAVLSVAQCIFYNSTFRHRKQATGTYHNTMRETPLSIYVGLLLLGETRKRSLVNKFYDLGLSVSYDRVLSITADLGNDISELYKSEGVVCPRQLRYGVFTTAAYDNIHHNPSSNTTLGALHGTAISLFHYPCHTRKATVNHTLLFHHCFLCFKSKLHHQPCPSFNGCHLKGSPVLQPWTNSVCHNEANTVDQS